MPIEAPVEASPLSSQAPDSLHPRGVRLIALLIGFACAGLLLASKLFATMPTNTTTTIDTVEVVVLKNGGTFAGSIIEHADHLVVRMDNGGEVRLAYDQVDFRAPTLRDAYVILAERNTSRESRYYLGLCDWCLKQSLLDEAAWQLELAERAGAENRFVEQRRLRLESLLSVARADAERLRQQSKLQPLEIGPRPEGDASRSSEVELASAITDEPGRLTPELIAEEMPEELHLAFQQQVQPRLVHGCSAARCHGPSTPTAFELERVARGRPITRNMTQRNLAATLQLIDPPHPESSSLLAFIAERHADVKGPIYPRVEGEDGEHYRVIESWVVEVSKYIMSRKAGPALVAEQSDASLESARDETTVQQAAVATGSFPVRSIPSYETLLQQPDDGSSSGGNASTDDRQPLPVNREAGAERRSIRRASFWDEGSGEVVKSNWSSAPSEDAAGRFLPRDPFDPEIFNRYIRGELKTADDESKVMEPAANDALDFPPPKNQIEPPSREISPRSSASKK